MDRNLALELVRVTEAAALVSSKFMGRGDKNGADGAAVEAMRKAFESVNISGEVVIGEGELESDVKKQTKELGIDNCVIFAGIRKDVNKCMQAMDLFLLPSRFEGLPVVGIEAQAAGLPCLMADTITKETDLFGLVYFMSLNQDTELWAEKMIEVLNKVKRQNTYHKMVESGYDISLNKESLKEIYVNVINR